MNKQVMPSTSIALLVGGRSQRMGSNKLLKRISGKTLLRTTFETACAIGLPVQLIRRDIIEHCGPLSGVITAFRNTTSLNILFLAGDMPWVTETYLRQLVSFGILGAPVFSFNDSQVGFPFVLQRAQLEVVEDQIERNQRSLQRLFLNLNACVLLRPRDVERQLMNVNTPHDLNGALKDNGT
ncbi:molybdenum cofactor guanylyltransferase [Verrucomicrobia bacterium]|nr:molybdenum cofactor guanylyltransferase [Verrucomicrobiota bacterium]